jgi:hypothetical protein
MIDFNTAAPTPPFEDASIRKERVYRALQGRVREFVRYLYPRAVVGPKDARIGDVSGSKGLSLSISVTADDTAGRWIDHATGDRGDVFGLYAVAHNLDVARDFAQILAECDAWAGGTPAPRAVVRHEVEAALAAKIETLSQQFADLVTAKLEAAVVEDAPADDAPAAEPAPEPVAAEAKAEVQELSQPVPSVIAAKVIELEASRGTQPLEVSTETTFSRADLLSQFNAEKDPRRAAEIFKKLQLAR